MATLTGAQALLAALRAHGVSTIFGIPGVHTLPIYDALRETEIRHVLARHEQGAGFMADGYARVTGRPGVVCTITGPGVTNVSTAMADAYADSLPLLVISSSMPRAWSRRPSGDLHELKDQFGVMEALAGWSRAVETVEEIPDALRDAFRAMHQGRPRGAYLQVPLDLLAQPAELGIAEPAPVIHSASDPAAIAAAAALLRAARFPIIVAGAGVTFAGANERLMRLATLLHAPVLLGGKSRDALPSEFPLAVAVSGYGLAREVMDLVRQADVALVIGSKLGAQRTGDGRLTLPASVIQIDIDPGEIGLRHPVTVPIVADAGLALDALLVELTGLQVDRSPLAGAVLSAREGIARQARRSFGGALDYLDAVRAALPSEGVVVADMTMLGYAAADYLPVHGPRTFLHAAELCTIGCGLPIALGAKVAVPDRPVVALCGDGGFLLNTGELATAVQERIDVVTVVFNDATYTAVKDEQRRSFGRRYVATDLVAPDYVALARAFGAAGVLAESPEALRRAIVAAADHAGPTLIEVPLPSLQWGQPA